MSSNASITDFDPSHPVLYVKTNEGTLTLRIRRNETNTLWVDYSSLLGTKAKFDAYVVAPNQKGIIEFKIEPKLEGVNDTKKFDVIPISPDERTIKLTNRRQFFRLKLDKPLKATLVNTQNVSIPIKLISLSAGGIAFSTNKKVEEDEIYLLTIDDTFELPLNVAVQLLKPRSLGSVITNEESLKSETKIPAFFITSKKQTTLPILEDKVQSKIIQLINQKLRKEQTIRK